MLFFFFFANLSTVALSRTGAALTEEITRRGLAFEQHFNEQYGIKDKSLSAAEKGLARTAISSLIGSIGCDYGGEKKSTLCVSLDIFMALG